MSMLWEAARYAGVSARVHALWARFLPGPIWEELLDAPDIASVTATLRQSWYHEAVDHLPATLVDGVQLERALTRHWVLASRSPLAFLQGASRAMLDWYERRWELNNLKTILRARHHQIAADQFLPTLIALDESTSLPWDMLATVSSITELVERLQPTWYGKVLRPALEEYRRQQSVFVLEVALDLAYYRQLRNCVAALGGRDRSEADQTIGFWINAQNLLWAFRYRIYARLSPEEILNYTLHHHLRVNATVIRTIALGAPLMETVQQLWGQQLPELLTLSDLAERDALPKLELLLWRHLFARARRIQATAALHLGAVLAYEILLESEVRDLITLIEGKAFNRTSAQIKPYLIGMRGEPC